MADIGYAALLLTLVVAVYSAVVSVWGARSGRDDLRQSGQRGIVAAAFLVTLSVAALLDLLLKNDFRYQYVYESTSTFQPLAYHISALWQGQAGSILFWLWALCIFSLIFWAQQRRAGGRSLAYALAVLSALEGAFAVLLMLAANPFAVAEAAHVEGFGGNPLLENPGMIYHPPIILAGYALSSIPFALVIGGLLTGKFEDRGWLRDLRPWVIVSWLCLTIGILLGAQWAYVELGWGGYWAWDPVENASLIPWLVATALLHTLMMQERRGMFKLWNALLVAGTFLLCVFATWVTRGGVISSVHAFGQSMVGNLFLLLLIALIVLSFVVIRRQRRFLRSEFEVQDMGSREASFLYTAFFFCGAAFLVFLGTIFPALSEAVLGQQIAWGAESFNNITRILGPFLLVLLGVCPLLGWKRTDGAGLVRALVGPLVVGVLVAAAVAAFVRGPAFAILAFGLVAFVIASILAEFGRGWQVRLGHGETAPLALWRLVTRNRRRYGGYLVHLGVLLMILGITGQSLYQTHQQVALSRGETVTVGQYTLKYADSGVDETTAKRRFYATLQVYQGGRLIDTLQPERNFHFNVQQWVTEVSLRPTLTEDLYVLLLGLETDGLATFDIVINPLIDWLWIGGIVATLGALAAVWPKRRAAEAVPELSVERGRA